MLNQTMFVQFVIYYACALDHPSYTQKFLQLLFQTILDPASPVSEAMNSINYIASFLTRAKFVDAGFVKEALEIFLNCLDKLDTCDLAFNLQVYFLYIMGIWFEDHPDKDAFSQLMDRFL